jgi:hypothetical protein
MTTFAEYSKQNLLITFSNNVLVVPEEVHIVLEVFIFVLREGDHLGDLGLDARIILRWIIQEVGWGGGKWTGSSG